MADRWRQKVEVTGLQGLADLERIEGPFLNALTASDLEGAAVMLRLLLAHMASTSKRVCWQWCWITWTLNRCQRGLNSQSVVKVLSTDWVLSTD